MINYLLIRVVLRIEKRILANSSAASNRASYLSSLIYPVSLRRSSQWVLGTFFTLITYYASKRYENEKAVSQVKE
jgi:hypothetical protein